MSAEHDYNRFEINLITDIYSAYGLGNVAVSLSKYNDSFVAELMVSNYEIAKQFRFSPANRVELLADVQFAFGQIRKENEEKGEGEKI